MNKKKDFIESYYPNYKKIFNISVEEFEKYYNESLYGGYPEEGGGSIWESEGKFIYVLIRTLKPKKILEIGNFKGKSSNHILQAVEKNGFGNVTLLDISDRLEYDKLHNKKFERIINDSLKFLNSNFEYDLIIQDGDHTYNHVKKEIELILKNNNSEEYYIWSHDYHKNKPPQCEVAKAWNELKNNFKIFETFKDSISDCGFCISKK